MMTILHNNIMRSDELTKFVRYCMVGVLNTVVCLGIIFITKSLLGWNPYLCNALGYTCGVINSFLWNKTWVFRSQGGYSREAVKFVVGFGVCYALQFMLVYFLTRSSFGDIEILLGGFTLSGYGIATLLGNVLYTVANFIYNRCVTFKKTNSHEDTI